MSLVLQGLWHDLDIDRLYQVVTLYNSEKFNLASKRFAALSSIYRLQHLFEGGTQKRIIVTEFSELHLLYTNLNVYIKPLPAYLLNVTY